MFCGLLVGCAASSAAKAQTWSWQEAHAQVTPEGDLLWSPWPFVFEAGDSVRYIDFASGDDAGPGTREAPWKHHPWDPQATGNAAAAGGVHTYVFKRGVVYRGALTARESGEPGNPIRLTSDPSWGEGEAVISGAEVVTGWTKGTAHRDIPEPDKVWVARLDYAPRRVWTVDADGQVTRIPLARTPNWQVSDPEDVMSEWWTWENPEWWVEANRTTTVDGKKMHLGTDTRHLTRDPEYYRDAIVWTEWAIVMGTPFPVQVAAFYPERKAMAFEGRWFGDSGQINAGNRYFLEDKPHYLDEAGEFWFEKTGEGGRLHIRLPGDRDPNAVTVEAARHYNLIQDLASARSPDRLDIINQDARDQLDLTGLSHVVISGLTFRFTNAWWDLPFPPWMHKEVNNACVRLLGSSDDVRVSNCRFEYVTKAVRIEPLTRKGTVGSVVVSDNEVRYTDDAAINIGEGPGHLQDAQVLRNSLFMIGLRPYRQSDAHALTVAFPETMEVAGNMLLRCYGSGIFLHGGKPSGEGGEVPLSRCLIHHNKAEQTLLAANDWGGIETWQGGPFYVFSNISANPNGYWNWAANKPFNARLGFAYYLDGSFKNYLFNNIAWGQNNDADSKLCNASAFYEAVATIHNSYFNNTVYRFAMGSSWSPSGGHHRFLGNVWSDISNVVFMHGKLKEDAPGAHGREYPHELMAYGHNVFHAVKNLFGVFEVSGEGHPDFASFREALGRRHALDPTLGASTDRQPLRDPASRDMRPADGSAAIDYGVKFFVPWGLSAVVGEWNFYHVGNDVATIPDEHWYMTDYFGAREGYHALPQYPLKAVNVTEESYVQGELEDWVPGALKLNGRDQYAFASHAEMSAPLRYGGRGGERTASGPDLRNLDVHASSFILEAYFRTEPAAPKAVLIKKMDARAGYALTVDGAVTFSTRAGGADASVTGATTANDGRWHHVLAEADGKTGRMTVYLDGRKDAEGAGPGDALLSNTADFYVGGSPEGDCLAGTVDFARVSLGSLADAKTTIEELYEWQFNGPFLRDFAGNEPTGERRDAGALEYQP
ncbi:MAG: hypothetical protein AMK73_01050 [Planctomycetes bacterium SM23_32]|nr:MAG: hypothetical protein AMK73_01050 [Planctomycetes bacterium SM23_32]